MTTIGYRLSALGALSVLVASAVAPAARADEIDTLNRAIEDYNDAKYRPAAEGFYKIEETSTVADNRFKAEYYLAQSLSRLSLGFGAFFYYGQIIKAGPSHPYYFKSVEGALRVTEESRDEVLGPNVLNRAYNEQFARLAPEALAKINYYIALLGYRSGRYSEAEQFLQGVPRESSAYAQAHYVQGLLAQRGDPTRAVGIFQEVLAMDASSKYRDLKEVKELTHLALGRTFYGMGRYSESSYHYGQLPRFSRHWDEGLFEGAYADLLNEDPGGALGKLHSLHSPHLSDEFAPESETLEAIIYYQNCLYGQVRQVTGRFDRDYVPMRDQVKRILESNPSLETLAALVAPEVFAGSPASGAGGLPAAVQHHLSKNERIAAMLDYVARLDQEAARIQKDSELAADALGKDLLDLIGKQRALVVQVAGKFVKGRLADLVAHVTELDAQKRIIAFETTKGEKEFLEQGINVRSRLASQSLNRPEMPEKGHEYWPFDGEYWPDEIGYYRYTIKNACSAKRKDEQ